jgi:nucleoside-diphosphate-sugar epimerase
VRVVVLGASGNVGTSVLRALGDEPAVESVVGVARRIPDARFPKVTWRAADVARSPLGPILEGADAAVHLAWLIQPGRDRKATYGVNVIGSDRVFAAVAAAGVRTLVYASSVGAYGPGPRDGHLVDESWPTTGIPSSFYSRDKAEVERLLDAFERDQPQVRVVRMRPALIFKRQAASGIRRLFIGPLLPGRLARPELLPLLPLPDGLAFQAVHSLDVGDAYRRALLGEARGAFNLAAEPVLDAAELGRLLGARPVGLPPRALRAGAAVSHRLRLQPSEPGWLDMGMDVPLMDTGRARRELGWEPRRSSTDAVRALLEGLREGAGLATPPLEPGGAGPARLRELLSGVGSRTG